MPLQLFRRHPFCPQRAVPFFVQMNATNLTPAAPLQSSRSPSLRKIQLRQERPNLAQDESPGRLKNVTTRPKAQLSRSQEIS